MRFACFSAAAVADEAAEARHHHWNVVVVGGGGGGGRRHRGTSLRSKLFGGRTKGSKKCYSSSKAAAAALDDVYDAEGKTTPESYASSVPWSSASSLSLDSARSSSSSSTACCSRSSSSLSDALSPPAAVRPEGRGRRTPAAGVAAVIVCLVMVMLCGRVGATALASAAFYLFPRRWRPVGAIEAESAAASPEQYDLPSSATKRKVVKEGFFVRNGKK